MADKEPEKRRNIQKNRFFIVFVFISDLIGFIY